MNRLTWPTVGLIAVLGAAAIGLATLAHWDSTAILGLLGILGGLGGGATVAGAVASKVDDMHSETAAQTDTLATIAKRVDGDLDRRIQAAVESGAARALAMHQRSQR